MIEILKRQKQEQEEQPTLDEIQNGFDELDLNDFDAERVLEMMDKEERQAFERAIEENTLIETIRADIEPWVSFLMVRIKIHQLSVAKKLQDNVR